MAHEKKVVETPVEYDPQYILQVKDLKKHFPIKGGMISKTVGHVKAVDGVTFNLKRGTTMGLVGESGCGKSTTGRTILRLAGEKTGGQVLFNGKDVYALSDKEKREMRTKMQIIFQDPFSSLQPRMPVGEIIGEALDIHKLCSSKAERTARIKELLGMVGLNTEHANRYPHEFSGGQSQRVNIARALSMEPKIIVCDEPVSALDVSIQAQVITLFRRLQKQFNLTYVFISHDLGIIKYISDRIMIMYLGRVMEFYTSEGIYADPKHPYTKALLSAIPPESPFDKKERLPLTGDIPSPIGDQVGCPLAGRCPHCTERCKKEIPKLVDTGDGHMVACFLYE